MEKSSYPSNESLKIRSLGKRSIISPLNLSTIIGDDIANYTRDDETVLYDHERSRILELFKKGQIPAAFEAAGPRKKIFFQPEKTKAGIVTCGGLCPGINNVIRSIVMELFYGYKISRIYGFRYGYMGFIKDYGYEPIKLSPDSVADKHYYGGSMLSSSRGPQDISKIVDRLEEMEISLLFTIGGDGTLSGANEICKEINRRKLHISVIGVPKTIDNDIAYVEKTFGLETAFSIAAQAVQSAHTEALGALNGIGIVKVMGRLSGFIAAYAALALNEVNFVLIPEMEFDLYGDNGFLSHLEKRIKNRKHAVILVAEGAGQSLLKYDNNETDASGNKKLGDIGEYMKQKVKEYFKNKTELDINVKYIDPSYMVRSSPANAHDAIFCTELAQNAVHAGMAGKTGIIVGRWNSHFTHVPIELCISERKQVLLESPFWRTVIEATGQPFSMVNEY